jgi:hypothetical protein
MNMPIRMISVATTIIWVFLGLFVASAAISTKDIHFGVGEPQFTTTNDNNLILTLPLSIDNQGYYSLNNFNFTTTFSDAENNELSKTTTFFDTIQQAQNTTILHNVTLGLIGLAKNENRYLFNDTEIKCTIEAGVNFAEILPVQLTANVSFPWGAPFYNFSVLPPLITDANETHVTIRVPITFVNHAVFNVTGSINAKLYDGDVFLAESQTDVSATRYWNYFGNLHFTVPANTTLTSKARLEFFFPTPMFEYGPVVIPYD